MSEVEKTEDGLTFKEAMSELSQKYLLMIHHLEEVYGVDMTGLDLTATRHDGNETHLVIKRVTPNEQLSSPSLGGNMSEAQETVAAKPVAKKKTAKKAKKKVAKKAKKKTAKKVAKKK